MNVAKDGPSNENKISSTGIGIWIILGVVIFVYGVYWVWVAARVSDNQFDRLNTLFSGLAFWGVIYAILLQKSELSLQRKELALTRGEVRGQKEQLEAQNLTLKRQRFENTFFSLLNLFTNLVSSMEYTNPVPGRGIGATVTFKGRECFTFFYSEFQKFYTNQQENTPELDSLNLCMSAYETFAVDRQTYVGHYFRTLYNIIKFIETSKVETPQIYVNILRAQLSSSELNLLFYNCLSKYGNMKFKPYVEQFGLLENMTLSDLARTTHKALYNYGAFQSQIET